MVVIIEPQIICLWLSFLIYQCRKYLLIPCCANEEFNTSIMLPTFSNQFLLDMFFQFFSSSVGYLTTSYKILKPLFLGLSNSGRSHWLSADRWRNLHTFISFLFSSASHFFIRLFFLHYQDLKYLHSVTIGNVFCVLTVDWF